MDREYHQRPQPSCRESRVTMVMGQLAPSPFACSGSSSGSDSSSAGSSILPRTAAACVPLPLAGCPATSHQFRGSAMQLLSTHSIV